MIEVIKNEKEDTNPLGLPSLSDLDQSGAWKVDDMTNIVRIINFDNGKLFKGHSGGLHVIGDYLTLTNCYWTNVVIQKYDTKSNKTHIEYMLDSGENPKYVREIIENSNHRHYKFVISNIQIDVYEWAIRVTKKVEHDGLKFYGHWDNINQVKGLRHYLKKIKSIIKNDPEVLDKNGKLLNDNCYEIKGLRL